MVSPAEFEQSGDESSEEEARAPRRTVFRSRFFPPPRTASPEGLLCVGGQLTTEWLCDAYRHGIFPWPIFAEQEPLAWWSPDPRAILELHQFHAPQRLRRTARSGKFSVTLNHDFTAVITGCATAQSRATNTWLTPSMIAAYIELHEAGYAHSVEVWQRDELAGGIYGVAIGAMFAAESKFYTQRDASKLALLALVEHLQQRNYSLLDIQQMTDHSKRFGATEIPRSVFMRRLATAVDRPVTMGDHLESLPTSRSAE